MIQQRPIVTFVYLPVYLKDKYFCSAVFKCGQSRFKEGDIFLVDKRPATYAEQQKVKRYKAIKVEYNLLDPSCLVELERATFETEKEVAAFMSGKHKI